MSKQREGKERNHGQNRYHHQNGIETLQIRGLKAAILNLPWEKEGKEETS